MITYNKDKKLNHKQDILNGLRAFNRSVVGIRPNGDFNVYIYDSKKLLGACSASYGWDWLEIEALYYDNDKVFYTIMNAFYKAFKDKLVGIMYNTHIQERMELFKNAGFIIHGKFEDMPVGYQHFELSNKEMVPIKLSTSYEIVTSDQADIAGDKILKENILSYNAQHDIDDTQSELSYVAMDDNKLVGGVYGYTIYDYLYISYLWVKKDYRNNDIATNLMSMIENDAIGQNYKNSYLGTSSFQAKGLYEKLNYKEKMLLKDCPKGFNDHIMIKSLS